MAALPAIHSAVSLANVNMPSPDLASWSGWWNCHSHKGQSSRRNPARCSPPVCKARNTTPCVCMRGGIFCSTIPSIPLPLLTLRSLCVMGLVRWCNLATAWQTSVNIFSASSWVSWFPDDSWRWKKKQHGQSIEWRSKAHTNKEMDTRTRDQLHVPSESCISVNQDQPIRPSPPREGTDYMGHTYHATGYIQMYVQADLDLQ